MAFTNQEPATVTITLPEFKRLERAYNIFEDGLKYTKYLNELKYEVEVYTNDEAVQKIADDNKRLSKEVESFKGRSFGRKLKDLFS